MISGKPAAPEPKPTIELSSLLSPNRSTSPETRRTTVLSPSGKIETSRSPSTLSEGPDSLVMIKRTYNFAGKVHTEQKLVPRNSAEAKLFLATNAPPSSAAEPAAAEQEDSPFTKPKRPLKKARRSIFEPVIDLPPRTDLYFGTRKQSDITLLGVQAKVKKFNTVEKSAMDWAGFVDKEGIADELDAAGKSKGAYKARQEFLARVEAKKVEDDRRARGLPALLWMDNLCTTDDYRLMNWICIEQSPRLQILPLSYLNGDSDEWLEQRANHILIRSTGFVVSIIPFACFCFHVRYI